MKLCPFCAEPVQDAATVCKHCRRDIEPVPGATFPYPPIPGARPTSAWLYFFGAILTFLVLVVVDPVLVNLWVLGLIASMVWVVFDARTHKIGAYDIPAVVVVGCVLCFPYYMVVRSRIRAGVQPIKRVAPTPRV
jgi:hypothetical protein